MKLISLVANNFKKHVNLTLDFTDGLNVIIGPNWAGKSSVLEALVCALYGQAVLPAKKEDIPTWGKTNYSVQLVFTHNQESYLVERSLRNAEVKDATDSSLLASGHTACTKFIEDLLGLSFKTFALFVLSQQGETTGVLTFGATALQRQVEDFSGADIIDKVVAAARQGMNRLQGKFEEPEVPFSQQIEEVMGELKKLEEELQLRTTELEVHEYRKHTRLTSKATQETELKTWELRQSEVSEHLNKQRKLTRRMESLAAELKAAKRRYMDVQVPADDVEALNRKKTAVEQQVSEVTEQAKLWHEYRKLTDRFNSMRGSLQSEITELTQQLEAYKTEAESKANAVQEYNALQLALQKIHSDLSDAVVHSRNLQGDIKQTKTALSSGVCSGCDRPFEGVDTHGLSEKLAQLQTELKEVAMPAVDDLNEMLEQKTKLVKKLEPMVHSDVERRINQTQEKLEETQHSLSHLKSPDAPTGVDESDTPQFEQQIAQLRTQLGGLETEIRAVAKAKQLQESITKEAKDIETLLENCKSEVEDSGQTEQGLETELQGCEAKIRSVRNVLEQMQVDLHETVVSCKESEHLVSTLKASLEQTTINLKAIQESEVLQRELYADIDRHKRLIKHLTDSRAQYMQKVWDHILGLASKTLATSTQGVLSRVLRDESGNFMAEERGKLTPLANLSGAQKAFVGVSVRVGLSAALYGKTGLLILDEPSADMNAENSLQLAGALMGLGGQCLLITHRPFEQLAAQNLIEIGG